MPQVVTASRLRDGVVVFLGPGGGWVEALALAAAFDDPAPSLAAAKMDEARNVVVDVFAFEVVPSATGPRAVTLRDAIRAAGPTVSPRTC